MNLLGSEASQFLPVDNTILHRRSRARIGLEVDMILQLGELLGKEELEGSIVVDSRRPRCCFDL